MSDIKVKVEQQSTKVRVGQQNAVKVSSSIYGVSVFSDNSTNVIGGIASVNQLNVSGISTFVGIATFKNDVYIDGDLNFDEFISRNGNITGILTVGQSIYYIPGQPYGIAYFDNNDQLVSTATTTSAIAETNYILSTNSSGVPSWSNVMDGGFY
jgi:hypothetical protein